MFCNFQDVQILRFYGPQDNAGPKFTRKLIRTDLLRKPIVTQNKHIENKRHLYGNVFTL